MAEIRIQKKSNNFLPWLLGIAFLLLAGGLIFSSLNETPAEDNVVERMVPTTPTQTEDTKATIANRGEKLSSFAAFVENPTADMNLEHDYSRKALKLMAGSIEELSENFDLKNEFVSEKTEVLRAKAAVLDNDPMSTNHADHLKQAFMSATQAMEVIQQNYLPEMKAKVKSICEEAKSLEIEDLTLEQKGTVKDFFRNASSTLEEMAAELERTANS